GRSSAVRGVHRQGCVSGRDALVQRRRAVPRRLHLRALGLGRGGLSAAVLPVSAARRRAPVMIARGLLIVALALGGCRPQPQEQPEIDEPVVTAPPTTTIEVEQPEPPPAEPERTLGIADVGIFSDLD